MAEADIIRSLRAQMERTGPSDELTGKYFFRSITRGEAEEILESCGSNAPESFGLGASVGMLLGCLIAWLAAQ